MKKNDKRKIRIWKKTFALALSSVMIFSCIPITQVKAGDESPEAIINGLVDLPKTFIDKDSQDLGSDRVFYRNTNTDLSMLPAECYKKALQSYIIDDDVPMGTRKGDYLLSDWDYLGWILSVEKGQGNYGYLNDTLCNMTIYGNRRKSELKLDDAWYNWGGYFSESSLANAQQHIANDLTSTPLGSLPLKNSIPFPMIPKNLRLLSAGMVHSVQKTVISPDATKLTLCIFIISVCHRFSQCTITPTSG